MIEAKLKCSNSNSCLTVYDVDIVSWSSVCYRLFAMREIELLDAHIARTNRAQIRRRDHRSR